MRDRTDPPPIPGQERAEAFWEHLHERFTWLDKLMEDQTPEEFVDRGNDAIYSAIVQLIEHVARVCRDEGYNDGVDDQGQFFDYVLEQAFPIIDDTTMEVGPPSVPAHPDDGIPEWAADYAASRRAWEKGYKRATSDAYDRIVEAFKKGRP